MQEQLDLAKELIQQSRRLLYTTKEIMAVLDSNERILNSLLVGLENAVPVDVVYDWSTFPDWANFAATDGDGSVWAYQLQPRPREDDDSECWCEPSPRGKLACVTNGDTCPHWQSTLRQRPTKPELDVWSLVPDRAMFIAKDANGEWYWYTKRPQCENSVVWYLWDGDYDEIFNCPLTCDNWQTSLMERPHA